jgi:hypothetical protein
MKPSRVFWGVFFLSIGLLLLLDRLTTIPVHFAINWKLWPLLLVLWGIGALVEQRVFRHAIAVFCAIFLAMLLMSVVIGDFQEERPGEIVAAPDQSLSLPLEAGVERAIFTLESGAGSFTLRDTTASLVAAQTSTTFGRYELESDRSGGEADAVLRLEGGRRGWHWGHGSNSVAVQLHGGPSWEMRFKVGAARLDIDATPFTVGTLDISAGASTVTVKLGDRARETQVNIHTGASSVAIQVPESAGCEVDVRSALAAKDFRGFDRVDKGYYRTANFDSAERRISLRIDAGVSNLKIARY